jgi:putative acyl-CoA dehydrogenase
MTGHSDTHPGEMNQSSDYAGFNAFGHDPLLRLVAEALPAGVREDFSRLGLFAGSAEAQDLARLANTEGPKLRRFDEKGRRIDQVDFHPAYHALMRRSIAAGLSGSAFAGPDEEAGVRHEARAIRFHLTAGFECGHLCPLTMTNASVAALATTPAVGAAWLPKIASRSYDMSARSPLDKTGVTLGMGMTEKQGGTDLRANTTRAEPDGEGGWRLEGHKWFLSAPMSDAFLMLAQTGEGPTCFLVPRRLADGSLNGIHLQRLKDKLGNRSNASSEIELHGAYAEAIGEAGRGVRTIIEMVTLTRLDCAVASAGLMRGALGEAVHHCRERHVFGRPLIDQPQMVRVLADMALDVAAASALAIRLARSFDRAEADAGAAAWARVMTPATKYWVCKMAPALVYEAMECLGGNGYVEEGRLARAYREAPVNAIWEGSGNVIALDVVRVLKRSPEAFESAIESIAGDLGPAADRTVDVLRAALTMAAADDGAARLLTEQLAMAGAAAELCRLGLEAVADAFIETRLGGVWRHSYGMLDLRCDARAILDALYPPIR